MNSPTRPVVGYVLKMFPRISETFIRNEIGELERQGLGVRIFSLKRPARRADRQATGPVRAAVVYLPERLWREPFRAVRAQYGVLSRYPGGYLRTLAHVVGGRELRSLPRALRRFCQTCCLLNELGGARHLHAHFASDPTRLASWARMICGISYSVSTHAKDLFQDNRVGSPGLRYKLNGARFIVANSQYSATALSVALNGYPQLDATPHPQVVTIYNAVDLTTFKCRPQEPVEPTILSVGRLIEKKGFVDLLRACGRLKESVRFRCEIAGTGPMEPALLEERARLGLETTVHMHGERTHDELLPLYRRATVFALPCVVAANGDRDVLPNVLKEAMAIGVPIVTTRLEGIEELVTDGQTGLLVPPGDNAALAEALRQLLADGPLRRRLAREARKVIEERFDLRANFGRLKDLLAQAAGI
jgi:glycosyltransferase involved in cell wall biosynthesis